MTGSSTFSLNHDQILYFYDSSYAKAAFTLKSANDKTRTGLKDPLSYA